VTRGPRFATLSGVGRVAFIGVLLVSLGVLTGCGVMSHRLVRHHRAVDVRDWTPQDQYVERVDEAIAVEDPEVHRTTLHGRLRRIDQCRTVTVGSYLVEERAYAEWVNDEGEVGDLAATGGGTIASGLLMPLLIPVCAAGGCTGSSDDWEHDVGSRSLGARELEGAAIAGAIAGGIIVVGGLVDLVASGMTGPKRSRRLRRETETRRSDPYACPNAAPVPSSAELRVGGRALSFEVDEGGRFEVDLRPMRRVLMEETSVPWALVTPDGERAPIAVSLSTRLRLALRLEELEEASAVDTENGK
jgi:hypothetical protein